jgi:chlorobactene glucosyltransferase
LPEGWRGKNYAVATAAKQAKGDWLLFTDADVEHRPGSLATLLDRAEAEQADLLSVSPGQETPTWWEKAVIPIVYVQLAKLYRFDEVSDPKSTAAAANGQYILIRREVYERVGGHEAVRGEILEDVALARRVKGAGGRLLFLPGAGWASTRMYRSFAEMWRGWTKNLYLLYGRRPGHILATVAEMGFLDLLPLLGALVLVRLMLVQQSSALLALAAVVCGLLIGWRHALYAAQLKWLGFHQGLAYLRTPGIVLVSALLLNSTRIYCLGGTIQWKGRRYSAGRG